ncbi:hypothetical protein L7F22_008120 [Adiantum nelumboides]|nr:hypothetical protein [Adiantum nelumboides]
MPLTMHLFIYTGSVKEVREAPQRRHHKFVEFFDVRHAALALQALDGTELEGKKLKIEFSRPGGSNTAKRALASSVPRIGASSPINSPQSVPPTGHPHSVLAMPHPLPSHPMAVPNVYWHPMPVAQQDTASACAGWSHATSTGGALLPAPGLPQSYSGYSSHVGPSSSMASVTASASTSRTPPLDRDHLHLPAPLYRVVPLRHVAPRGGTLPDQHAIASEGRGDISERTKRRDQMPSSSSSPLLSSSPWRNHLGARRGGVVAASQLANETFRFDDNEAESSGRTTLMIRNIPNKYTQEMLIAMLDDHCMEMNRGVAEPSDESGDPISAFDFVYLPIDFKNRCNLGYAFVNLTTPQATRRLHKAFHGRQWDEFNSRKICEVSYARLQGREALEEHFKNSRFVCDMDEYLPVKFSPPRSGRLILGTLSSAPSDASGANDLVSAENISTTPQDQTAHIDHEGDAKTSSPPQSDCQSCSTLSQSTSAPAPCSTSLSVSSSSVSNVSQGIILGRRVHGYRHAGILQHHEP